MDTGDESTAALPPEQQTGSDDREPRPRPQPRRTLRDAVSAWVAAVTDSGGRAIT